MEREFLKSLAETRGIEARLTAEIRTAEGSDPGDPGTRKGALALQERVQELAASERSLGSQMASDRARFSALHSGWKVRPATKRNLYCCILFCFRVVRDEHAGL